MSDATLDAEHVTPTEEWTRVGEAWAFCPSPGGRSRHMRFGGSEGGSLRIEAEVDWAEARGTFTAGLSIDGGDGKPGYAVTLSRSAKSSRPPTTRIAVGAIREDGTAEPQAIGASTGVDLGEATHARLAADFDGTLVTVAVDGKVRGRFALREAVTGRAGLVASGSTLSFRGVRLGRTGRPPVHPAAQAVIPCQVNAVHAHPARALRKLSGAWTFRTDPEDAGWDAGWSSGEVTFPDTIQVPGCWEAQGVGGRGKRNRLGCYHERYIHPDQEISGTYTGAAWYRRRFTVPAEWHPKRLWLKLGGVHAVGWTWVNGHYVNAHSNHIVAVRYDVTDFVRPGEENTVTVLVDNRLPTMRGCFNDYIQCWGGLYRDVEIEAAAPVWVRDVWAIPQLDRDRARLRVTVENLSDAPWRGTLGCEARFDGRGEAPADVAPGSDGARHEARAEVALATGECREIEVPLPLAGCRPWCPDDPALYRLDITLEDEEGAAVDGWSERVGWRSLAADKTHIFLNGRPLFIAGLSDYGLFPETISAPADRAYYRRTLGRVREYGFNYRRHHTYVPVMECLQAADELGVMIQAETPYCQPHAVFEEIVLHMRNSSSLATVCMTNESYKGSPAGTALYHLHKRLDPTRFTLDSDGQAAPPRDTTDFWTPFPFNLAYYLRTYPRLIRDLDYVDRPAVLHEFLNIPSLPDPAILEKFNGAVLPPPAHQEFARWAEAQGLGERLAEFVRASQAHQKQYMKLGYETARSHPRVHGLGHWKGQDYLHSGIVGLFDSFYGPKAVTADEMHLLNGPSCLIALLERWTLHRGEALSVPVVVSHFANRPVKNGRLEAVLREGGAVVARAARDGVKVPGDGVFRLGHLMLEVPRDGGAARMQLELSLSEGDQVVRNAWDVWVYASERHAVSGIPLCVDIMPPDPLLRCFHHWWMPSQREPGPDDIVVTDKLNQRALDHLRGGGRLLLSDTGMLPHREVMFSPGWWSPHPNHTNGIVMRDHPALAAFPHRFYGGFQLEHLMGRPVLINRLPFKVVPIIDGINQPRFDLEQRGFLLETRVGKGRLLASGLALFLDLPESRGLLDSLVRYMASDGFHPAVGSEDAARALHELERRLSGPSAASDQADEPMVRWEHDDQEAATGR